MYCIGADTGGTFTDCVLVDRAGNHRTDGDQPLHDIELGAGHAYR
jgi:N-methylhydantoinase A/oxoprolinase/acetone carboxylase beta subunit